MKRRDAHIENRPMKIIQQINSPNVLFYASIFMVTQITGLLLSLVICYILQDFTWGFVRMALINSFILGLSLIGSCYLSQRLMFKMKIFYIAAISFSLVLGVSIISFFIVLFSEPTLFIYYHRGAISFIVVNFLFITALLTISAGAIIYREIMVEKEKTIGNERYLKNQMEMKLLSSRVNPHFLFNTLNTILTLLKQPAKAETAILNLSDLLRENLEHSDKTSIPVKQELENVRKYLEIQKLRFGEKLHYEIKGDADFPIPPLIIQPLVENSIKHNIQNVSRLTIEILVSRDNGRNSITIMDSEKAVHSSMLNRGQGLTITKKRIENGNGTFLIKNGGIEISFGP
jgi:two-component system, LytTR family, sensor kinase